jgi:uncharacterized protein involved in exopolysaccharide biosynthesis
MPEDLLITTQKTAAIFPPAREVLAIGFRHRRLAVLSFSGALAAALIAAPMLRTYRAQMRILVRHERVDPVITTDQNPPQSGSEVSEEEELNSEAELLKSEDLLRNVVLASGLFHPARGELTDDPQEQQALARAVRRLQGSLAVKPIAKTHLIEVTYESSSPKLAANVLNTLAKLYLDKHLEVYRTPGQYQFFEQQAERYRQDMEAAQAKLASSNFVAPQLVRDMTLQKLADFNATLEQTRTAIRETQERIDKLEQQQATVPSRLTTQVRRSDNQQLLQQLKSKLLDLELKRAELLSKYQPSYQPVREVEEQIADTRAALAAEESAPVREEVTDQNPTHEWIGSELAKARADLQGLQARAADTERTVAAYNANTNRLEQNAMVEQDLVRAAKAAEENYLLYHRKGEEARISDALDERRILNVAVAQNASAPALPAYSTSSYAVLGFVLACFLSIGLVVAAEYLDPSYRTPDEVTRWLDLPVLAALPKASASYSLNGHRKGDARTDDGADRVNLLDG